MTVTPARYRLPRVLAGAAILVAAGWALWPYIAGTQLREICAGIRPGMTVAELAAHFKSHNVNAALGEQITLSADFAIFRNSCRVDIAGDRVTSARFQSSVPLAD